MTLRTVFSAFSTFLYLIRTAIIVYCVMSWFRPNNRFFYLLQKFIAPFLSPFRRFSLWLMSRTRLMMDLSCLFALVGISVLDGLLWRLYRLLSMIH